MRKIKILGLLLFLAFAFLPLAGAEAAVTLTGNKCSKAADCKIGDLCTWTNSKEDKSCGDTSLHARCRPETVTVLGTKSTIYVCQSVVGMDCSLDDQCNGFYCVNKTCSEKKETATLTATATSASTTVPCNVDCKIGGWFKNTRKECICCGSCTPDDLLGVANTALEWLFSIVGALGLAMFIYGGFLWVTSAGDSGKVSEGKKAMVNAVIGLLIMFASGALVLTLQKTLGVQQTISITGKATTTSSSSSSSSSTGTAKNGTKQLGEACTVLAGSDSECLVGYYCYNSQSKTGGQGVCIPKNPQATLNPGDTCYYMPNSDAKSLCKSGKCNTGKTTPVVGDKGTCPEATSVGGTCKSNSDCEASGLFSIGSQCYNGTCIPLNGRNVASGGACYILPGSGTNDCMSGLTCIPQELVSTYTSSTSRSAYIGKTGICYEVGTVGSGYQCTYQFECSGTLKCDSIHHVCVPPSFVIEDTVNQTCDFLDIHFPSEQRISSCVPPYECVEVDGVNKCQTASP